MQQPTDSREVVHLVDFDMLAAEGSPLDLEDDEVYLNAQDLHMKFTPASIHYLPLETPQLCPKNTTLFF